MTSQPWKIYDLLWVLLSVAFLFFAFYFFQDLLSFIGYRVDFATSDRQSVVLLFFFLLQNVFLLVPLYFFTFRKYGSRLQDFGFNFIKIRTVILCAVLSYLLFLAIQFTFFYVIFSFGIEKVPGYMPQEPYLPLFGNDALSIFIAMLVVVGIAPFIEELFFRGFVLQTLVARLNPFWGSFICALIFTAIHFEFQSFFPIFILALILNGLFLRTRNIWPGIFFHFLNNSLALLTEYAISREWIAVDPLFLFS